MKSIVMKMWEIQGRGGVGSVRVSEIVTRDGMEIVVSHPTGGAVSAVLSREGLLGLRDVLFDVEYSLDPPDKKFEEAEETKPPMYPVISPREETTDDIPF